MGGVPASNLWGTGAQRESNSPTSEIISPPPSSGLISSSRSARPHRQPIPVGPSILWPLQARKSAPRAVTSTGRWGTAWAPSTTTTAPTAWAAAASSATGGIVPVTLDMALTARIRVRSSTTDSTAAGSSLVVGPDAQIGELGAGPARHQLPGDDVGVVLQDGEHDAVTGPEMIEAPAVRNGVERPGGAAGEHHFGGARRPDHGGHLHPRRLVGGGRLVGQGVGAPVDVGVGRSVEVGHGLDHLLRLLAGGGRVEVDQRPAVDQTLQDGEVGAEMGQVGHGATVVGRKASYPSSSTRRARSAPPLATMRPSTKTCTWVGSR